MHAFYPPLVFVVSYVMVFLTVLIFAGTVVGLVVAGGHLLEIVLGREIGGNRPGTPRSGR